MGEELTWSPDKQAGFVLAAWLADDRNLEHVAGALAPGWLAALRAHSAAPTGIRDKARAVQGLLRSLRPALDRRALLLPQRARALLARLAPAPLRRELLHDNTPARPHFHADEALLSVLLRVARQAGAESAP